MKAFASAVFLFTLAAVASSAQTSRSVWDGVFTDSQATRGDTLYRASCASCHGTDLNGGEMAPALRGGTFTSNWNDLALSELMDRIYQTMPANAAGFADVLTAIKKGKAYGNVHSTSAPGGEVRGQLH